MTNPKIYLGETLQHLVELLRNSEPTLHGLNYFLVDTNHYNYYTKYSKHFVGIKELGNRQDKGLREGVAKLADDIYLAFACAPEQRCQYVLGFARSEEDLKPYLLNTSQGKVFIVNYDYDLHPHEMKAPPEAIFLNDELLEDFQQDVTGFLEDEEFYTKVKKIDYKRSSLFYGPPGNGKTSLITWAATKFDKVFVVPPDVAAPEAARNINQLCTETESKLIVLEDLDSLNENTSDLLNFVDGTVKIHKAYFIGTTNFPDKLHENILSRPSRFDSFIEIPRPNETTREKLLRHHLPELSEEEYKKYIKQSKGLNASYFQEIAILFHRPHKPGKEVTIEQIIEKCKKRVKLAKTKDFKDDGNDNVGFTRSED